MCDLALVISSFFKTINHAIDQECGKITIKSMDCQVSTLVILVNIMQAQSLVTL